MSKEFALRFWKLSDADSISASANNPKIANKMRNAFPSPYSITDATNFIEFCTKIDQKSACLRAIDVDQMAVGSIGVFFGDPNDIYCKTATIAYWLAEPFWGFGIMSRAIKQISDEVFGKHNIVHIEAESIATNVGSCKALEKAGFQLEGILKKKVFKNGKILDSHLYALTKW